MKRVGLVANPNSTGHRFPLSCDDNLLMERVHQFEFPIVFEYPFPPGWRTTSFLRSIFSTQDWGSDRETWLSPSSP